MTAPVDLAEEAFYDRATGDSTLTGELGHTSSDERIVWGRPETIFGSEEETPAARAFPILTYFGVTGDELAKGREDVRIQCDLWVWPEGSSGGIGTLQAIDSALYDLFHKTAFEHSGRRFFVRRTNWRGEPPGSDNLLHRMREFVMGVGG